MCDLFKSRGFTMTSSSSFKRFLEHKLFLEMAIPGDVVKYPFQFEQDDIDFWNQFPPEYRIDAIVLRYDKLFEKIEKLEGLRKKAGIQDLIERTNSALNDFKNKDAWRNLKRWKSTDDFIQPLEVKEIDNLEKRRSDENLQPLFSNKDRIATIAKNFAYAHFSKHEKHLIKNAFGENEDTRNDLSENVNLTFFGPEKRKMTTIQVTFPGIKFHLFRLYERLEKTEGEQHSEKFQSILGRTAKYGFDLSSPVVQRKLRPEQEKSKSEAEEKGEETADFYQQKSTNGMIFPLANSIGRRFRTYMTNIEQRIFLPENISEEDLMNPNKYKWKNSNIISNYVEQWIEEREKEIRRLAKDNVEPYASRLDRKNFIGKRRKDIDQEIRKIIEEEFEENKFMIIGAEKPYKIEGKREPLPRPFALKKDEFVYVPVPVGEDGKLKIKKINLDAVKTKKIRGRDIITNMTVTVEIPEIPSRPAFNYQMGFKIDKATGARFIKYKPLTPQEFVAQQEKGELEQKDEEQDILFSSKSSGALHVTSNIEGSKFYSPANDDFDKKMATVFPGLFEDDTELDTTDQDYDGPGYAYFTENLSSGPSQNDDEGEAEAGYELEAGMTVQSFKKRPDLVVKKGELNQVGQLQAEATSPVVGLYSILVGIKNCYYSCKGNTDEILIPFSDNIENLESMYKSIKDKFMFSLRDERLQTTKGKISRAYNLSHNIFQKFQIPRRRRRLNIYWKDIMAEVLGTEAGSEFLKNTVDTLTPIQRFQLFLDTFADTFAREDQENREFGKRIERFVNKFKLYDSTGEIAFKPIDFYRALKQEIESCKKDNVITNDFYEKTQEIFDNTNENKFQQLFTDFLKQFAISPKKRKLSTQKKQKPASITPEKTDSTSLVSNPETLIGQSFQDYKNDQDWMNEFLFKPGTLGLFESINLPALKKLMKTASDLKRRVMLDVFWSRSEQTSKDEKIIKSVLFSIKTNKNIIYKNNDEWDAWADKKYSELQKKLFEVFDTQLDQFNFQITDDLIQALDLHAKEIQNKFLDTFFLTKLEEKIETKFNQLFPSTMPTAARKELIEDLEASSAISNPLLQKLITKQKQKMNQNPTLPEQITGTAIQREWRRRFFR